MSRVEDSKPLPRVTPEPVGLTTAEASRRLAEVGPNRLAEPPVRPGWQRFIDQFKSLIMLILALAAALAAILGDFKDAVVVALVLVGNATLGYVQEGKAENAMAALKRMLDAQVKVRRDGQIIEIAADALVPGDLVLLEAGDRIPADGRFIVAASVAVDEASLTGESVPVDKTTTNEDDPPYGRGFMNTTVVRGRAELFVDDTGMHTQMGQIAGLLHESDPGPTPLQIQLDQLGKRLAALAGVAVVVVFTLQMIEGVALLDAILGAVALAVAAIPEGLPVVVTVTLAVGVHQMAERNAIVKRLASVETLGSTTVICSDKTGTLTRNEMTARAVMVGRQRFDVTGEGYAFAGSIAPSTRRDGDAADGPGQLGGAPLTAALCSDARVRDGELIGDPTEGALLVLAVKDGIDIEKERADHPRLAEVPFDSSTKFMATLNGPSSPDMAILVAVKGAPDVVIDLCTHIAYPGKRPELLDDQHRAELVEANTSLAESGYRVLALASRQIDEATFDTTADPADHIEGLVFEALVGIIDPIRIEVRDAIELCRRAGIHVKMITGDHPATAAAIAAELGILGRVVNGTELEAMSDDELAAQIGGIGVCARVSPTHKVRVVRALQANGEVVAMTGDGVNDAPALRQADIGVAMGITGTEVSKDASDLVLADDNFATIVDAVEQGRSIYENISTFVRFQVTTNLGAMMTITGAGLLGLPVPLTAVMVLFINIIADGPPAISLGLDPPSPHAMARPPREPGTAILDLKQGSRLLFAAAVMSIGTIGVFVAVRSQGPDQYVAASTMAFTTFVFFQMINVLNVRSEASSVFRKATLTNRKLWLAIGSVIIAQIGAVTLPALQSVFGTTGLSAVQWLVCIAVASTVVLTEEARKLVTRVRA